MANETDELQLLLVVQTPTDPEETWVMGRAYGVQKAVFMGAAIHEGGIVVLFVQGPHGGKSNAIRMKTEALDRFCEEWLQAHKD